MDEIYRKWGARAFSVLCACMMLTVAMSTAYAAGAGGTSPSFSTVIEEGSMVETADYVVFTDDTTYFVRNGETGAISYRSTSAGAAIQYAMDALTDGGSAYVSSGTYPLTISGATGAAIQLTNNGTRLYGAGLSTVFTLVDDGSPGLSYYDAMLTLGNGMCAVNNLTVSGITFSGNGDAQSSDSVCICFYRLVQYSAVEDCRILDSSHASAGGLTMITCGDGHNKIQDCYFGGNAHSSIYVDNCDNITVTGCEANANANEMFFGNSEDITVTDCTSCNAYGIWAHGIYAACCDRVTVSSCSFVGNNNSGIRASNNNGMVISSNEVSNNGVFGMCLQSTSGGYGLTVSNNVVEHNGGSDAINVHHWMDVSIVGNTISDNDYCGIAVTYSAQVSVSSNTIRDCNVIGGSGGIFVNMSSEDVTVSDNIITNSSEGTMDSGIYVGSSAGTDISIRGNNVDGMGYVGIGLYNLGSNWVIVASNIITMQGVDEDEMGIESMGSRTKITDNIITADDATSAYGIYAYGDVHTIQGNDLSMNGGGIGIYADGYYSTVKDNYVRSSDGVGVYANNVTYGSIEGNIVAQSHDDGIYVSGGSLSIYSNTMYLCWGYGIGYDNASASTTVVGLNVCKSTWMFIESATGQTLINNTNQTVGTVVIEGVNATVTGSTYTTYKYFSCSAPSSGSGNYIGMRFYCNVSSDTFDSVGVRLAWGTDVYDIFTFDAGWNTIYVQNTGAPDIGEDIVRVYFCFNASVTSPESTWDIALEYLVYGV